MPQHSPEDLPFGLTAENLEAPGGLHLHSRWLSLIVPGAILLLALSGFLGRDAVLRATGGGTSLTFRTPVIIRSGDLFEMELEIVRQAGFDSLVVGIDASLLRDLTINSFYPGAEDSSEDGELLYGFGPIEPGQLFLLKIDGQVNPNLLGSNEGEIRVYDRDRMLVELPVTIKVRP